MRITQILAAVALSFAFPGCSTTHELPHGRLVGEAIQPQESRRFAVVDAEPAKFFDQTLLVEATVQAVCLKKGCWMKVEDQGKVAMVRWESGCGGQYAFPVDSVGKRVLIQGSFYPKKISEADAAHIQEEAGGKVEIPREGYEFNASAVLILEPAK
ncbi:MAG: DUF4920 domain-containing protein [Planctomycetota bacterium]|nr:DUF4920 domain-containing protein [Planctomycetota bacterium]